MNANNGNSKIERNGNTGISFPSISPLEIQALSEKMSAVIDKIVDSKRAGESASKALIKRKMSEEDLNGADAVKILMEKILYVCGEAAVYYGLDLKHHDGGIINDFFLEVDAFRKKVVADLS